MEIGNFSRYIFCQSVYFFGTSLQVLDLFGIGVKGRLVNAFVIDFLTKSLDNSVLIRFKFKFNNINLIYSIQIYKKERKAKRN
jgi:hypothetical protein